jgi:hypothetical protein
MLEFRRAVATTGRASPSVFPILPRLSAKPVSLNAISTTIIGPIRFMRPRSSISKVKWSHATPTVHRARAKSRQPARASASPSAESSPEGGAGQPKLKAAPAPATESSETVAGRLRPAPGRTCFESQEGHWEKGRLLW